MVKGTSVVRTQNTSRARRSTKTAEKVFGTNNNRDLGSRNGALGSRNGALGSRNGALGSRNGDPGSRNGDPGSRNRAPGSRNGAPGSRNGALGRLTTKTAENKIYKLTQVECKTLNINNDKYHDELFEIYSDKDSHNIKRYTLKTKTGYTFRNLFYWHHMIRKTSDSMQFKIAIKDIIKTPFGKIYIYNCINDSWFTTDYVTLTFEKINEQ